MDTQETFDLIYDKEDISRNWNKHTADFTEEPFKVILDYLNEKSAHNGKPRVAVDVGTGAGQSAKYLIKHFDKVLATDISQAQIECAKESLGDSVEYRVCGCDDLGEPDNSVDLIIASEAAQWFQPIENFYREADRVLKPNGVVAFMCKDFPTVTVDGRPCKELSKMQKKFWDDPAFDAYKPHFHKIKSFRDLYMDFKFPYSDTRWDDHLTLKRSFTLTNLMKQLVIFPAYYRYLNDPNRPDGQNPMDKVTKVCQDYIGPDKSFEDFVITNNYQICITMTRKPSNMESQGNESA